jgi:prolyl-tRNA editing enzyme YbaK/EbsC (Cys-tRNA(Pro) deacylase)
MKPATRPPATAAVRLLRAQGVAFTDHPYKYEERGGTAVCARELGVDEHACIKTLIMEDDDKRPMVVLMHGDREASTRNGGHKGYLVGMAAADLVRVLAPVLVDIAA